MTVRVLAAGDHFVLNRLLIDALRTEVGAAAKLEFTELTLPWPVEAFGKIAEVDEASGDEDSLIAALHDVQICVTQLAGLTEKVLASAPSLRMFGVTRGGPVNANVEAATRFGVAVTFAPGRNAVATAEHSMALILSAVRRIPATHAELLGGVWRGDLYQYTEVGPELENACVGLVGYGAIGSRVARMLHGFGARVLVYDPYLPPGALDQLPGASEQVELDELLRRSQVVTLHARVTAETKGMIGREQIGRMPAGSVLVNAARGALLDYDAMCDALDSGHLFGAGLDVFDEEPIPPGSRLLRTPNVVMTPHLAGASKETAAKAARIVARDVARYLRGERPQHCANPEVLAGSPASRSEDRGVN